MEYWSRGGASEFLPRLVCKEHRNHKFIFNGIGEVKHDVIMIAHRISTIKDCDIIILLEEGKISSIGSYESLIKESETFKNLAAET